MRQVRLLLLDLIILLIYGVNNFNIDKKIYIFGGWNGKDYFNDVNTFDLEKMVWSKLETSGSPPVPRQGHASCVVGHNLIIQGVFYFDEENYKKKTGNYGSYIKSCYLNDIKLLDLCKFTTLRIIFFV